MLIRRQHSKTEVQELYGKTCDELLAVVPPEKSNLVYYLYLRVNQTWHQFSLDAGLLFWEENVAPDEEEDISSGEVYRNLGIELKLVKKTLSQIEMNSRKLSFCVEDGSGFRLIETEQGTFIEPNHV